MSGEKHAYVVNLAKPAPVVPPQEYAQQVEVEFQKFLGCAREFERVQDEAHKRLVAAAQVWLAIVGPYEATLDGFTRKIYDYYTQKELEDKAPGAYDVLFSPASLCSVLRKKES